MMKKSLALPRNSSPPPGIKAELLDFSKMHSVIAKSYPNHFALVIDNCLTPEECEQLISIAETDPSGWHVAQVNIGGGQQMTALDVRNSKRIIRDDYDMASFLLERVKPFLDEVTTITRESGKWKSMMTVIRNPEKAKKFKDEEWEMTRLNERMRFLKYGPDEFFEPHVDGCFTTLQVRPDEPEERTHLTFQAYLRASPDLKGGATRFFAWTGQYQHYYDVKPIPGRVLIFQHRDLLHSGDVVSQGEKIALRSDILYRRVK